MSEAPHTNTRSDEHSRRLVGQCLHIAEIYDEEISSHDADGYRIGGVNPFGHQTESGLYLEISYNMPSKLWTPWGYWRFAGTCAVDDARCERFLSRFSLRVHEQGRDIRDIRHPGAHLGYFGPVYAILDIEGDPVETPGPVHFEGVGFGENRSGQAEANQAAWARFGGPHTQLTPTGRIGYLGPGRSIPLTGTQ
ncbi:hypothetical protein ACQP2U_43615 (plasmid) [Nocardia sp. CA-084685]|uniref:hypothetical protein n=1 Tax=Nocardia sp. CA-084685 TaxID=3239970 RepID=UPI003D95B442